ncbi:Bro-N domain-containing protein [Patescibacteria group bacterium]|nr:Bro-N domain-containing protein [Patescibacteria group bacterium]
MMKKVEIALFQGEEIRRKWIEEKELWFFSIVDVIKVLTQTNRPRKYWDDLKRKLKEEGSELSENIGQLKLTSSDGKKYLTDVADLEEVFRIIQSIPSPKAEPFKQWLARVGKERIDEINNPELAVNRAKEIYEKKGYPKDWVEKRMRGIAVRNTLTDEWKNRGAKKGIEYAILTDEIYRGTFDKSAKEYMKYKKLDKKEGDNLRDRMEDLELILTMLGEATTTKITTTKNSVGFAKLKKDAHIAGKIAGNTRKQIEKETGKKITSPKNFKNKKILI